MTTWFHTLTLCDNMISHSDTLWQHDFALWHFVNHNNRISHFDTFSIIATWFHTLDTLWSTWIMLWITECLQFCITTKRLHMAQDEQNIMGDVKVNVNTVLWQVRIYTGGGTAHHRGCERHFVWQVNTPTWCGEKRKSWRMWRPFCVTGQHSYMVRGDEKIMEVVKAILCDW